MPVLHHVGEFQSVDRAIQLPRLRQHLLHISGTHGIISAELERQQVHVTQQTLVSHLSTVHGMLESGFGVAVLPKIALPVPEHPTLVSIPLVQPVLSRTIGVYRRRDRSLSPAAAAFLDFTRDVLQELALG